VRTAATLLRRGVPQDALIIDSSAHLDASAIEARLQAASPSPADVGRVTLLCARPSSGTRQVLERARLDHQGMPFDRWRHGKARPEMQLAVMEHRVASVIANGQSHSLFGDNLSLDLDLSTSNLPTGSLVQMGEARLIVTPEPHTGCKQYAARFGLEALKYISSRDREGARLRGIYLRVVEPGEVWLDAPVHVLRRGPPIDGGDDGDGSGQGRLL
jgi:hypothetical protein